MDVQFYDILSYVWIWVTHHNQGSKLFHHHKETIVLAINSHALPATLSLATTDMFSSTTMLSL